MLRSVSIALIATSTLHGQEPADIPVPDVPPADLPLAEGAIDPVLPTPPQAGPSTNVTVNLISRLVQKGILTAEEAQVLIQQAEADAARATEAQAAAAAPIDPYTGTPQGQDTRVTYIPENVRKDLRDEIRQELMAQAREENWGTQEVPDWTRTFRLFGDFRGRYEWTNFGNENDTSALFTNYNAINSGAPFDVSSMPLQFPALYNADQDRERARIRLRAGAEIMLGDGFNAGIRLASGDSNSPTSTNQTLGSGGGNFSKYAFWLDRAFLSYDAGPRLNDGQELTFFLGRFDSPFFSSEVQWDDDIGFDGLAVRGRVNLVEDKLSTFFSGGVFPIFNTDFNFSSNQPEKIASTDRWLYAAQVGIDWKINDDWKAKVGLAYYDFKNVEGELSSPFTPLFSSQEGDTDHRRLIGGQRGNTRMPLRNIVPTPANNNGAINQWQYYGLASEFRNLTLTGKLEYDRYEEVKFSLLGEITKNLGFDESEVASRAFSDGRPGRTLLNSPDDFQGGDLAWNVAFQVGKPGLTSKGDWVASLGYRYVESDAVLDGFTDSDFGGGGTNLKGFTLGGAYAISPNVRIGARWMSADEIDGPPLATDTIQFDINARF
ncbi:putative porin [Luteolibacter sp. SL250]|uniref:putative porin n=1 Tax=Luteolibacter sp. SL250 TaxID=2995170 RepID=UPI00226D4A48|nr:putative porin [Luteolibacter sp. SL250]WAC21776.1 putative porin [Luteolibacter sp. SL250]